MISTTLFPPKLIAQHPAERRDEARLLVLDRRTGSLEHRTFGDLPEYLTPGDVLVINDTKVLPARLIGRKASGGKIEVLLVRELSPPGPDRAAGEWECLVPRAGRLRAGAPLSFADDLQGELLERGANGRWRISLKCQGIFRQVLERIGLPPLPPYIKRDGKGEAQAEDRDRYQTVYAREEGAIAAPTAGLHFTKALLERIRAKGVQALPLTLHVGVGTFLPVREMEIAGHRLEPESFFLSPETARAIGEARAHGKKVFAVGTTAVRTLESCANDLGEIQPARGETELFITPGHRFRAVEALVTNFHLPRSTLLMLVAAFAGRERILAAYAEAVRENYRFYSYGDAMLIL